MTAPSPLKTIEYKQEVERLCKFLKNQHANNLLKTLAVIKADTPEEVDCWETEWPVLHSVPMETTSKGKH